MTDYERGYHQGKADAMKTQEPVAWELRMGNTDRVLIEITNNPQKAHDWKASLNEVVPLYAAPRPWVGLTDAELAEFSDEMLGSYDLCLEVEAYLQSKNT